MGEDCSAKKLKDLKKGEKPLYLIIYGIIFLILGFFLGKYIYIKIIEK
jgi:hypothetical protein